MKKTPLAPADIAVMKVPNYAHGMVAEGATRWVHLSGQIGIAPDGTAREGCEAQTRQAFENIIACLRDADMTLDNVVMLRIYLVNRDDLPALRKVRGEMFGDRLCPSTLIYVAGLVQEHWVVELEVVAAG
ncbi:MAG: RidA family protein [Pseudomonadota bacterium]